MKKICVFIRLIIVGLVFVLLVSCNTKKTTNEWDDELAADEISLRSYQNIAFYDGYSYFPNLVFDKNGKEIGRTLVRQNLTTGAISFACPDPLCSLLLWFRILYDTVFWRVDNKSGAGWNRNIQKNPI